TRRRAARGIEDDPLRVYKHEIAAPSHRFYNEQHLIDPAGGVSLFAVQLEHALQPRLLNRADPRVAQVLANQQTERTIAFDTSPWHFARVKALNTCVFQVRRQQHARASDARRERLDSETELVDKDQLLNPGVDQEWFELVAHGRERQRVKAHRS